MSIPDDTDEVLAAVLIQISGHAERISTLDSREEARYSDISTAMPASGLSSARPLSAVAARAVACVESLISFHRALPWSVAAPFSSGASLRHA